MDADSVLWAELTRRGISDVSQLAAEEVVNLALRYGAWVPVNTYVRAPWLAPYAVRKIRIRTDHRAPGPKRDLWGLPDEYGYFTDDNSLIKGVFRNRSVTSPSPYGTGKFRKGMVCCHIWARTTSDPLLFSFVPNLVWLPRTLAPFSDAHLAGPAHLLHDTLKHVSIERYRSAETLVAGPRVNSAWQSLSVGSRSPSGYPEQCELVVGEKLIDLVDARLRKLSAFLAATLDDALPLPPRFSKRYHAGVGRGIDPTVWPVQQAVSESARRLLLAELEACSASRVPAVVTDANAG